MDKTPFRVRSTVMLVAVVAASWHSQQVSLADEEKVTFEKHISPIFQARCVKCHGEGKLEGGLDLRRRFLLVNGGDSGAALVEGKPEESLLIEKISKGEMPPKEEGK